MRYEIYPESISDVMPFYLQCILQISGKRLLMHKNFQSKLLKPSIPECPCDHLDRREMYPFKLQPAA